MALLDRILAALKPKVKAKGFSQKTIEGIAAQLAHNLVEESSDEDITSAVDGFMPIADLMQSENTRYANEVKKGIKPPQTPPTGGDPNNPENPEQKTDDPVLAELKKLSARIEGMEKEKTATQLLDGLKTKLKDKVPAKFLDTMLIGRKFNTQEEADEFATVVESGYAEYAKEHSNGVQTGKPPAGGGSSASLAKKGASILDEWANSNKPAGAKETTT